MTAAKPSLIAARERVQVQVKRHLDRQIKPRLRRVARRLMGLAGPWVWGTHVGDNRVLIRTASGYPMLAFADDMGVTPELLVNGEYDAWFVRFLGRVLERGDVAVDVGANIGLFTVTMATHVGRDGRVFAYEANPEVFALLADNVYLNTVNGRIGGEVTCRPAAVGEAPGSASMRVRAKHRGMGTIVGTDAGPAPGEVQSFEVPIVDLDAELADITEVKLVKIDVEGAELGVLRGMRRLTRERRVRMIDLELIEHAGVSWPDLADELRMIRDELGGRFHTIDYPDGGLAPATLESALHGSGLGHLVIVLPGH